MTFSMLGGIFESIVTFFEEIFNFIPKIVYLLYASLASVIDVLQLFFRKVAGLDVYYVDGKPITGDLVTNFIGGILGFTNDGFSYSALTTVFWAFIVFGVIMVFITTFVAIIKSHYSYDDKAAKGPLQYVYTAGKALINIAAVPIIVFVGLFVSQSLLTAVDTISSTSAGNVVSVYGTSINGDGKEISMAEQELRFIDTATGKETCLFYDFFGFGCNVKYNTDTFDPLPDNQLALIGSSSLTFSGQLFKLAAYNGNRARLGQYRTDGGFTGGGGDSTSGLSLFANATSSEDLAVMIDTAFASSLHLKNVVRMNYAADDSELANGINAARFITSFNIQAFDSFSKFNIGLVWYYYDLWQFNFIVAFAACLICVGLFINIIMGLLTRLFMCIGLFLVAPPFFGLAPLDGGKAGKSWTENFLKQVLMTFGAVVGMNLFFLILPLIYNIDFFNIPIADYFIQALIIVTGLVTIKAFIAMISGLVGSADANEVGGKVAEEVGKVSGKAIKMSSGAFKVAAQAPKHLIGTTKAVFAKADEIGYARDEKRQRKDIKKFEREERINNYLSSQNGRDVTTLNKNSVISDAMSAGLSKSEAKNAYTALQRVGTIVSADKAAGFRSDENFNMSDLNSARADFGTRDAKFKTFNTSHWNSSTNTFSSSYLSRKSMKHTDLADTIVYKDESREKWNKNKHSIGDGLTFVPKAFVGNLDSTMGGSKLYSAFKENSFWKKKEMSTGDLMNQQKYQFGVNEAVEKFKRDNGRYPNDNELDTIKKAVQKSIK